MGSARIGAVRCLFTVPRVRAVLRREFPLAGFVAACLAGQVVGLLPGGLGVGGAIIGGCGVFFGGALHRERLVAGSIAFVAGVVLGLSALPQGEMLGARTSYRAEVVEAPRYPRTGEVRLVLKVVPFDRGGDEAPAVAACAAVDLPWRNINGIVQGDTFVMRGVFTPVKEGFNPFTYGAMLRRRGITATCKITHATGVFVRRRSPIERFRERVEGEIGAVLGGGERAGLVVSMSIGARDVLSGRTEYAFKATGLAHLLVVSGFQVTVVYHLGAGLFGWVLRRSRLIMTRIPVREVSGVAGLCASLGFVAVCGVDGASLRAGFAVVFAVVARLLERGGGMVNGILVSLLGLSVVWPGSFLEPGVQLTYAALAGIALAEEGFVEAAGGWARVREGVRGVVIVWVFSTLVSIGWFGAFAPLGLILNPIVAPVASIVGCQGSFLGYALTALGIDRGGIVLRFVGAVLITVRDLVVWFSKLGLSYDAARFGTGFANDAYGGGAPMIWIVGGVLAAIVFILVSGRLVRFLDAHGFVVHRGGMVSPNPDCPNGVRLIP